MGTTRTLPDFRLMIRPQETLPRTPGGMAAEVDVAPSQHEQPDRPQAACVFCGKPTKRRVGGLGVGEFRWMLLVAATSAIRAVEQS
jgi:hypothetical protein